MSEKPARLSFVQPMPERIGLGWYTKDLLPTGVWKGRNFTLPVDESFLGEVSKNTNAAIAGGLDIPFQDGHGDSALDGLGKLHETWVGFNEYGDLSLWGLFEVTDPVADEKVKTGSLRNISVGLVGKLVDGEGRDYGRALEHVAATPYPVVHRQGEFHEAPEVMAFSREMLPETVVSHGDEFILMSRDEGVHEFAVSMGLMPKSTAQLPPSAFLHVGNKADPSTWVLPVYEGAGPLKALGGVGPEVHVSRGALNRQAVLSAAKMISGASHLDLIVDDQARAKLAKRLLGLFTQLGESAPESLKATAGVSNAKPQDVTFSKHLSVDVHGEKVESLAELIDKREQEQERRTAWWAFEEYVEAIMSDTALGTDEKTSQLKAAIDDLVQALGLSKHSITVHASVTRPGIGSGEEGDPMLRKFFESDAGKALLARAGFDAIPDTADDEWFQAVLSKVGETCETLVAQNTDLKTRIDAAKTEPKPKPEPKGEDDLTALSKEHPHVGEALAKRDARIAELERREKKREAEAERNHLSLVAEKAQAKVAKATEAGKLSKGAAEAATVLLSVEAVERRYLAKDATEPTVEAINVRELVEKIIDELPVGACLSTEERTRRMSPEGLVLSVPKSDGEKTEDDVESLADDMVAFARTGKPASRKGE